MSMEPHGVEASNRACFVERDQHGFADRVGHFDQRHNDARSCRSDDLAVCAKPVQVTNEAGAAASDQFDMVQPRHVNVGGKVVSAHVVSLPAGVVVFAAGKEAKHGAIPYTSAQSLGHHGRSQNCKVLGERAVNGEPIVIIGRFSKKLIIIDAAKDGERA